jgi:hypothetical protein
MDVLCAQRMRAHATATGFGASEESPPIVTEDSRQRSIEVCNSMGFGTS